MEGLVPVQESARRAVDSALEEDLRDGIEDWELQARVWEILSDEKIFDLWYPHLLVYFGPDTAYEEPHEPTGRKLNAGDLVMVDVTPIRKGREHTDLGDYCSTVMFEPEGYSPESDSQYHIKKLLLWFARTTTERIWAEFSQRYGIFVGSDKVPVHMADPIKSIPACEFYDLAVDRISQTVDSIVHDLVGNIWGGQLSEEELDPLANAIKTDYGGYRFCLIGQEVGHVVDEDVLGNDPRELLAKKNSQYVNRYKVWAIGPHIGVMNPSGKVLPFAAKFEDCLYGGKRLTTRG